MKKIKATLQKALKRNLPNTDEMLVDDLCYEINDGSFNDNFFFNPERPKDIGAYNESIINELLRLHLSSTKTNNLSEYLNSLTVYFPNTPQSWLLRWVKGVEGISVFDQFGQNFVNLGSIYNRRPNKFLQLENKIFPKDDELQKIYQKICKCGYLSLNLLNELKTYIYDKGRIVKEVPDIVGLYDREGITAYLLRAGNGKYAHSAYSIRPTDRERYSRWEFQHKLLSDYARLENIWYTSKESFIKDFKLTLSDKKGTETDVYLEPSGHYVFKFLKILTENCLYDLLAERILIHNLVFGDKTALRIEGFILEGDNITFAISQPFVKDAKYTTDAELEKFINSPSFSNYHKVSNTCVANSDLVISDLHKQNVLIDKKGQYFVIDCFAKFYRTDDINNDDLNYKPELFKSKDFKIRLGSLVSEPTKQTFYENLYNQLESIVKDDSFEKNGIRNFILSHIPEDYKNDDIDGIVEVFYQRLRALKCGTKGLSSTPNAKPIGKNLSGATNNEEYIEYVFYNGTDLEFDILTPYEHNGKLFIHEIPVLITLNKTDYSVSKKIPPLFQFVRIKKETYIKHLNNAIWNVYTDGKIDKSLFVDFYSNPNKYKNLILTKDWSKDKIRLNFLDDVIRYSDFKERIQKLKIGETEIIDFTHYNYYKALQEFNSLKDSKSPFAIKERAELAAYLKKCEKNFPKDYNKHLRSKYLIETDGEYILKFGDTFSMPKNFERIDLLNLKRTIDTEKANAEDYKYDAESVAKVVVYKYLYKMAKKVYRTRKDQPILSVDKFVKKFQMQDGTYSAIPQILRNEIKLAKLKSEPQDLSGTTDDYKSWETRAIIPSLIKKHLDTDRGAHLWEYFQNLDESQKVIVSALIKDKRQHNTVVASVLAQKKDGKIVYNAYTDKWQTPYSGRYQFITPDTDFKTAIANAFDGIETDLDESIGKRINPDNPLYKFDENNYNVVCEYGAFYNSKLDIPHLLANEIKLAKFKKSGTPENYRIDLHIAKMKERNLYGRVVAKIRDGRFSSSNIHQNLRTILTTYGVVDKYIPDATNFVNDYKDNVFPVLQRICVLERLDMPEPSQPKFKIGDMVKPYSIGTPVKIENVYKQNGYYFYNIANHSGGYREDDLSLAGLPVYSINSPSNTSFKIGSLIRYKDSDGTIYKIVDTTDKGYVVLDLSMSEPFRQRNVIPFANNNQLVEFPILFYNEIEYAKVVSKQHLNGICGIPDTDKYLACLAEHEDWHRCIVDEYTFIDKPNKIARRTDHGYIQRQIVTKNKAEGEKFCEETEQLFSDIISRFPGWVTPDPIIRYTPKQGLYYRQLRFTYEENDKFLQVIPAYLAITNADISKFEFVFDKYSAAKSKCCKFEYTKTTTEIPLPEQEQKRTSPFKFDYDSHISAFIKTLDSPQAKKTQPYKIKKDFDKFYQDIFHYTDDLDDIRWIAENNNGWTFVEDNIMGGLTREIYDYLLQDPKTGDYSYNRLQLAKIYYQRLCAECSVTPSATFYEVFYPLFTNEIEYSKIKAKK